MFLYLSSKGLEACGEAREEATTKRDMSRKERSGFAKKHNRRAEGTNGVLYMPKSDEEGESEQGNTNGKLPEVTEVEVTEVARP